MEPAFGLPPSYLVNEFYKKDVKKKLLPRPEGEKIGVSRSSPLSVSVTLELLEGFCSGWFAISVGFIFR